MLFAQLTADGFASLVVGAATVLGAAAASYGAVRAGMATLTAEVRAMHEWLRKVDRGDTAHVAAMTRTC